LPAALAFFHRAFAIADSLALVAALIVRLGCIAGLTEVAPLILAHLALAPAAILARAAALIFRFCGAVGAWFAGATTPRI